MILLPAHNPKSASWSRSNVKNKHNVSVKAFFWMGSLPNTTVLPVFLVLLVTRQTGALNYEFENSIHRMSYYHEDLQNLHWDHLDLQFLTNVKGSSLHHANKFHVVNATFPNKPGAFYILHLIKSEDLFHSSLYHHSSESGITGELECLFTGTITQENDRGNSEHPIQGQAALSSCHHEMGFEGLVLLPNEQYYIHPKERFPSSHSRMKTSAGSFNTPSIPHKAYKLNDNSAAPAIHTRKHYDDIRIPSLKRLKRALADTIDFDHFEDEEGSEIYNSVEHDNNDNNMGIQPRMEETDLMEDDMSISNSKRSMSLVMVPLLKGPKKESKSGGKNSRNTKTTKNQNKTPSKAVENYPAGTKIVEIAVFTDVHLFNSWKSLYPNNTRNILIQYVLAIINNVNILYNQPSMTEKITFRVVYIEIQTEKPKIMNEHNAEATKYLDSFCKYSGGKNQQGILWDHAILLTGLDLVTLGSNSTSGIALFGTMCINGYSCSISEAVWFGSTFTTAHEVAHSLGVNHDGIEPNTGCDPSKYIMAANSGAGQLEWSKCSMKSMKDFINNGANGLPPPKCLSKKSPRANAIKAKSTKLPGQQFNAKAQCAAQCKGCIPFIQPNDPEFNNICRVLVCQTPGTGSGLLALLTAEVIGIFPALEGTTCLKGKICRLGKCVPP